MEAADPFASLRFEFLCAMKKFCLCANTDIKLLNRIRSCLTFSIILTEIGRFAVNIKQIINS